jgi:hypothetical protein
MLPGLFYRLRYIRSAMKSPKRKIRYILIFIAVILILSMVKMPQINSIEADFYTEISVPPRAVRGKLRFSAYNVSERKLEHLKHTSVFINGPDYDGMEDNDLRGFLDGVFKYGWNQSGQIHVRVGRRKSAPRYGEHELFRVLHHWRGIELPPAAEIIGTHLTLTIEQGPPFDVSVLLYEVKKEWTPGQGGTQHDNTSPPQKGEVWWNDVAYLEKPWGLPGAGFASDQHPDADTAAMPLAEARYHPGDRELVFTSAELTDYLAERIRKRQPLLLLVKQSDYDEDRLGGLLALYSGNYGDSRNLRRRPQLTIEWTSRTEAFSLEKEIFLEHGRFYTFPRQAINGATSFAVSFEADPDYESPTIEIRGGTGKTVSPWRRVSLPFTANWEWIELRLSAVTDPVSVAEEFVAQLRDTWVVTRPPEEQKVLWTFISPTAQDYKVEADYQGGYTWRVHFQPKELGRWHYYWTQHFTKQPYTSVLGTFDVVATDLETIKHQLQSLRERMRHPTLLDREHMRHPTLLDTLGHQSTFETDFVKLERAALQLETPQSFTAKSHHDLYALLRDLRALLWGEGKPIPERIPLLAQKRK